MRRISAKRLNEWIEKQGDAGVPKLLKGTGLSIHTISRMVGGGYHFEPSRSTRKLMCMVTGIAEDELFPEGGESHAS